MKRKKSRTSDKSKVEYEQAWLKLQALIRSAKERSLDDPVEILEHIQGKEIEEFLLKKHIYDIHKKIGLPVQPKQPPKDRLTVKDGDYIIAPKDFILESRITDLMAQFIAETKERIDCVVEFGSGIGRNLFILADKLEPQLRAKIEFYACEFTDAGRKACAELLELKRDMQMTIEHFDYYHPDFSFLEKKKNILFFTRHSIEQIPILNRTFFDGILNASNQCFCYHAEPVGWQYDKKLLEWRRQSQSKGTKRSQSKIKRKLQKLRHKMYKLDRYYFERYGIGFLDASRRFGLDIGRQDIGKSNKVSLNAAKWSAALDYNTNLVSLIKDLEKKGLIRIDLEKINLDGANPFNPSTIIAWHKA